MQLRTRLDLFSAALLSALSSTPLAACGGSALVSDVGAGSGNAGFNAGGSAGAARNHYPCQNPHEIGGGIVSCDGFTHRTQILTCSSKLPRPDVQPSPAPIPPDAFSQCSTDSDCTEHPHGWCTSGGGQVPGTFCNYGCVEDSECSAGQLCECGEPVGRCVQALCRSDAECKPGLLCRSYDSSRGCATTTYACQQTADQCGSDADCQGGLCALDTGAQRFSCLPLGCAIGRPFLVDGEQRVAPAVRRSDWNSIANGPALSQLRGGLSTRLAQEWTRVALLEHASIAAFARFTLQLMSLGAPPALIERATSAMADETKHAQACFAVATAYAEAPVGPGPLAVDRSLEAMSLRDIVLCTIREGCVGETVAAIEAREAREHTTHPLLCELLLTISQDEARHAELAFCFVQWALNQGDATLRATVRDEFEALQRETEITPRDLDAVDRELLEHGVVPTSLRQAIRARAIEDVILPCARALYAPRDTETPASAYPIAS